MPHIINVPQINYMRTSATHLTDSTIPVQDRPVAVIQDTQTTPVHSLGKIEHTLTSTVMVTSTSKPVTKGLLFKNTYSTFSLSPTTLNKIDTNNIIINIDTFIIITAAVGLSFIGLILTSLTAATILLLCHKVKQKKRLAKNVPESPNNEDLIDNTAYVERPVLGHVPADEHMYDHPTVSSGRHNTALTKNKAYNAMSAPSHDDISVSRNCAYRSPSLTDGKADLVTSANNAYTSTEGSQSLATDSSSAFSFTINSSYQESQYTKS